MSEKLALVTGGSRGIGKACAMKLAHAGYDVVINYAGNEEAANKTVEEIKSLGVEITFNSILPEGIIYFQQIAENINTGNNA